MDNLTIAIAKGRIEKDIYRRLKDLNMEKWIDRDSRKLIFTDEENHITYIHVKPSDVVTYVEKGVADLGIVGKDTILENENKSDSHESPGIRYGRYPGSRRDSETGRSGSISHRDGIWTWRKRAGSAGIC